ncbi:glycoside hydrolase family 97 catalytic domain-containing protein [Sunxiuqinia sp. A32]|uniref:glycoside hydrolase family 97 catalytic domain-containing protein n=1 Tax=Sunxiuqinia sp. A32 TaxID=3461496 RepID=UPI00404523CB
MKKECYLHLRQFYIAAIFMLLGGTSAFSQTVYTVKSPDNSIVVSVTLDNQQVTYSVTKDGNTVISTSSLGINTSKEDFTDGLSYVSETKETIDETYTLPSGKKSTYTNHCNVLNLKLSKNTSEFEIIFRAYDDGVAYRYSIPGTGNVNVYSETSEFAIANFDKTWGQQYRNGYSEYYPVRNWQESVELGTFAAPVLVKNTANSIYCILTEAANIGNYSTSTFKTGNSTGLFYLGQNGSINTPLPVTTPWRTMIIGDLPTIVESVMIENLNPPSAISDVSWIKPGKASWDWGGEEGNPDVSVELAKKYIDLAADMGWEYYLQDEGWDKSSFDLQEMIDYATSKNVGVLLWSHSNRFQNDENQIRNILSDWKVKGVKGIKVDFWKDDSQTELEKYDKLNKIAAEQRLMLNLHGCTKPSGLRRSFPNLITTEAVLGGEMYLFVYNSLPANHNITLTMSRNVIGAIDYTPLDFGRPDGKIKQYTTWGHQLALGVVFESGIQHMVDSPNNYKYHIAKEFLKKLPAAWDDIKCLEASPDEYTTIARRKGDEWYLGSLCKNARTINIDCSFLNNGTTYYANIFKDGDCDSEIKFEQVEVTSTSDLSIDLRNNGGASIYFSTSSFAINEQVKYEAEADANTQNGVSVVDDPDDKCSNDTFIGNLGNGNSLVFNEVNVSEQGRYAMTVYYMTGGDRDGYIKVNDGVGYYYTFKSSGGYDGAAMAQRTFIIPLNAGDNTIEFGNDNGWSVNIDRITIQNGGNECEPVDIWPNVNANGEWKQTSSVTVDAGETLSFDPQPNDGTWSWTGPDNFSSDSREFSIFNMQVPQAGDYVATYTNPNGCSSTLTFKIKVDSPCEIVPFYKVDNSNKVQNDVAVVNAGETLTLSSQLTDGTWSWTGPNDFSADTRDLTLSNIQKNQAGTYNAVYTGPTGCIAIESYMVYVNDGCQPSTITPYVDVDNSGWTVSTDIRVGLGGTVSVGPQPLDGEWKWVGPNGFTLNSRTFSFTDIQEDQFGKYTGIYQNDAGCVTTVIYYINTDPVLSVSTSVENKTEITCFPNPASNEITINKVPANTDITILDINARVLLKKRSSSNTGTEKVNVSKLVSGIYFIKIGNSQPQLLKFVKR